VISATYFTAIFHPLSLPYALTISALFPRFHITGKVTSISYHNVPFLSLHPLAAWRHVLIECVLIPYTLLFQFQRSCLCCRVCSEEAGANSEAHRHPQQHWPHFRRSSHQRSGSISVLFTSTL
jgi:hypothetical protein